MMNDDYKPINKDNLSAVIDKLKNVLNPTITDETYSNKYGIRLITNITYDTEEIISFSVKALSTDSSNDKTIYCIGYLYNDGSNNYCASNLGSYKISEIGSFIENNNIVILLVPENTNLIELLKTEAEVFITEDNKNHITSIEYITEEEYDYYTDNNYLEEISGDLDVNFYYVIDSDGTTYIPIENGTHRNEPIDTIHHAIDAEELTHDIELTVIGKDNSNNTVITGNTNLVTDGLTNTLNLTVDTDAIIDAVKADFTLDPATDLELGGIKLTTSSSLSTNQFPVELDLNNAAYVDLTTFNPDVTVDIFRFESMPSDSTVAGTTLVQYIGESTADYTYGYFYTWAPTNFIVTTTSDAWSEVLSSETGVKIALYNKENNYIFNTTDPLIITLQDELEAGNSILPTTKFSIVQSNIFSDTLTLAQIQDKLGFEMKSSYIIYDPTKNYNLSISLAADTSAWRLKNVQPTLTTDTDLHYKGSCLWAELEGKIPTAKVGDFYTITDKSNLEYFFNGTITSDWEDSWEYMGEIFTPYEDFDGTTHGLVPASGDSSKILNGVGQWIDIPSTNVKSDWDAVPGSDAEILNKPNLSRVATSGSYNDLLDKPTFVANNGSDIGLVGNPEVTSSTTGNTTVLTFHQLKGEKGDTGDTGDSATIQVGSVTSGQTPNVINSGTSTDAIFDFVLPKGDTGDNGYTPYIDPVSKHWIINTSDTGIVAEGQNGANGTDGNDGNDGITPHIDSITKHWMIGNVDTGVIAEGLDGTGVSIKPDQASCTQVGDAYIDANGHLLVLTDITTYPYTFTDAGEIKGPAGVSCTHNWSGTVLTVTSASGTSSADLLGPAGADGNDGTDGTCAEWFTGTAITTSGPATIAGSKVGDMYLNTNTYNVYQCNAVNNWLYKCNIKGATGVAGTLNTNNSTALTTSSSESFNSNINLHKVAKTGTYADLIGLPSLKQVAITGSYNDLSNKPSIPVVQDTSNYITINGNGSTSGTSISNYIPVGTIQMYAGSSAPTGWLLCSSGSSIEVTAADSSDYDYSYAYGSSTIYRKATNELYRNLVKVIGRTYGGDGTPGDQHVYLPNFSGRFPLGVGESTATGHTNHSLGDKYGEETHTLITNEMPAHNHTFNVVGRNSAFLQGGDSLASTNDNDTRISISNSTGYPSISNTGGSQPHNNMPPYLTVNFIIKY